jgi:hypothetical protein
MREYLLARVRPYWGRMTPSHSARFGAAIGSVAYIAVGPIAVLIGLPERFRKADPVVHFATIEDVNRALAAIHERQQRAATPPGTENPYLGE